MTEQQPTNTVPAYLVRVAHPDGERTEQVRLDAEDEAAAPDAARRWLAGAHNDDEWLKADAELVTDDTEPEGAGTLEEPAEPADADEQKQQLAGDNTGA